MTIITVPDGETVPGPGAYRMSLDWYHGQKVCPGPSISSSGLRTIELQSPHMFWAFSHLNPKRFIKEPTAALDFGKAAHALLLGDEVFEESYRVRPDTFDSYRSKAAQEWRDIQVAAGRTCIIPDEYAHIANMAEALHQHGLPDVIFGGEPEVSLIWQDKTGVWVKARPDALPETGDLGDLKTTADASRRACEREIEKRGYDMQMALGIEGMERVLGRRPPATVLIFVQKTPPYTVTAIPISEDALYWARCRNRRAINTFAECLESGVWPSDGDDMGEYQVPAWLAQRLSDEQSDGRLPNLNAEGEVV